MMDRFRLPVQLAQEPHFNVPMVVFQSDDWGHTCAQNRRALARVWPEALLPSASPWSRDARETADDVRALARVLRNFRDCKGRPAGFTLNFIVREPDFESIEDCRFERYSSLPLRDRASLEAVVEESAVDGVFEPALHGAEHLAPTRWLAALRAGTAELRAFFDARTMPPPSLIARYPGLGAAYLRDPSSSDDAVRPQGRRDTALATFANYFGRQAEGFVAPNHAWDDAIEDLLSTRGISFMQATHVQYTNWQAIEAGQWRARRPGRPSAIGLSHQTRTVDFEPAVRPAVVDAMINRACMLALRGIPVVVNTHRINYASPVQPEVAERARAQLGRLLAALLKTRPDIRFLSSSELDLALRANHPAIRRRPLAPVRRFLGDMAGAVLGIQPGESVGGVGCKRD